MEWNDEYQKYALKVMSKCGLLPPMDHIGFAYLVFTEIWNRYDPLKSNPLTYYGYNLKERIQNERRYGSLVHVPVMSDAIISITPIDAPVKAGEDLSYHDILPDLSDAGSDAPLLAFLLDNLADMYTKATKNQKLATISMQRHIVDGEPLPRKLRTELCWVRAELYERYKKWNEID